ncbi:tumor necrosis factor ligand superfamily member 15 [Tiliqua scincoides]|uniref:tumor necrosis factor ligand superfamily member 15 n=1 Tax=Tiliqua scincoides TaxID=71010 RepID=UPI0034622F7C
MDRAIQIPLQEVRHSSKKSSKGERRRLGCMVAACLVFEVFLAFPVVYLLGAHFGEQQPPRQEAELGPEPAVGRYAAQTAAESSVRKSRPMIHLQAEIPKDIPNDNCLPILHWNGPNLELFHYSKGFLVVPEEGDYFVYSHVTFQGQREEECKGQQEGHSSSPLMHLKQQISRGSERYGSSAPIPILTGSATVIDKSVGPKCKAWRKPIYLGAFFHLYKGDRLMVNVSDIELVKGTETFFGLASLN